MAYPRTIPCHAGHLSVESFASIVLYLARSDPADTAVLAQTIGPDSTEVRDVPSALVEKAGVVPQLP